jgi:hypothetical protein
LSLPFRISLLNPKKHLDGRRLLYQEKIISLYYIPF